MVKKRNPLKVFFTILFIILIILVLVFFGAKILVYARFFLGNDILVKLNSDKQFLTLQNGQEETIKFTSKITTSPLCKSICESRFIDITNNLTIEENNFSIKTTIPILKEYTIKPSGFGRGLNLYRFDLECHNIYSDICHTEEEPVLRSILITTNRELTSGELEIKNASYTELTNRISKINEINSNLILLKTIIFTTKTLSNTTKLSEEESLLDSLFEENLNRTIFQKDLWSEQNFQILNNHLKNSNPNFYNLTLIFSNSKKTLIQNASEYNSFIKNITDSRNQLNSLKNQSIFIENESLILNLNSLISRFNSLSENNSEELDLKYNELSDLTNNIISLSDEFISQRNLDGNNSWQISNINSLNFQEINLNVSYSEIISNLTEPEGICCTYGVCKKCCENNECKEDPKNYPLIFIHGHDFSKKASADYSFENFKDIQQSFEKGEGYLNAGTISLYIDPEEPSQSLAKINNPLSFRVSYYFDYFKDPLNPVVVQSKSENIDTYAVRLKEIIEEIKIKTNRPKVNIVSYSMGGLVARRYIQLFGSDDINHLVIIATPNKGIEGDVSRYCSIFGEKLECDDMDSNSLFMNKLNREGLPNIKIYNVVGVGCLLNGEDSDGIVLKRSAVIEADNVENIFIKGTCNGVNFLHTEILKTSKYPETYKKVKEILEDETK